MGSLDMKAIAERACTLAYWVAWGAGAWSSVLWGFWFYCMTVGAFSAAIRTQDAASSPTMAALGLFALVYVAIGRKPWQLTVRIIQG